VVGWAVVERYPLSSHEEFTMSTYSPSAGKETREARIEAIMKQLRPMIEQSDRQMVERAVEILEAHEFGAVDFEFRGAGQKLVNVVRQASLPARNATRELI
jgi:hypothetical protein